MKEDGTANALFDLTAFISEVTDYNNPIILLAFDEIGSVSDTTFEKDINSRQPENIMTSILYALRPVSSSNLVVTALSSYAHVHSIVPHPRTVRKFLSKSGLDDELEIKIRTPFIEFSIQLFEEAEDTILGNEMTVSDVCRPEFFCRFGRPM